MGEISNTVNLSPMCVYIHVCTDDCVTSLKNEFESSTMMGTFRRKTLVVTNLI